ncbi:hypothetical protein ACFC58_23780 [Kitasatospora purpeofusca]|uniref:hypothetical protein n=1 Tax=Kitasatospora purpeofusca TaxID=67352 RepID=UPI0035D81640
MTRGGILSGLARTAVLALWGGILVMADHVLASESWRFVVIVLTAVPMAWALNRIGDREQ